jgi:DNA mismatch endonuclease, patch repair protein
MQRQARRDTKPEVALRKELWRRGLRYRVDLAPLVGLRRRADILFTRAKVVVYVDGCFWHTCPDHSTVPKANREWWIAKLEANVRRDRDTDVRLQDAGWTVVRVWEHESAQAAADQVINAVTPGHAGRPNGS